jgi:hypothetical protein
MRHVVLCGVMGAGIGKSVKYRSESPSRRTSAAKLHIPQQLCCAGGGRHYAAVVRSFKLYRFCTSVALVCGRLLAAR